MDDEPSSFVKSAIRPTLYFYEWLQLEGLVLMTFAERWGETSQISCESIALHIQFDQNAPRKDSDFTRGRSGGIVRTWMRSPTVGSPCMLEWM